MSHGPVWEVAGPGTASSGDRGPHMGVGFKNSKKDSVAVGGVGAGGCYRVTCWRTDAQAGLLGPREPLTAPSCGAVCPSADGQPAGVS